MKKAVLFLSVVASAGSATSQAPADPWHDAAVGDIGAAFSEFKQNHPGEYDPKNKGFRAQLLRARNDGLAAANRARSYSGYAEALGAFSAQLRDGHARLIAKPVDSSATIMWPGFVTAWRGNSLFVQSGTPPRGAALGDRIASCDGLPIRQVIARRLRTQGMRLGEAGHWWSRSPQAFVDAPTMNTPHPKSCILVHQSFLHSAELTWTQAPADINTRLRNAATGERTPIGLSEPRRDLFLIGLPDFNPDGSGVAAYEKLFSDLRTERSKLLRARAIVLDLRWNDGGSSEWPRQTADLLWGKDAVERRMNDYLRHVQIWWRASTDNLKYVQGLASQSAAHTAADPEGARLATDLARARARGKPFVVEPVFNPALERLSAATDLKTSVYVIVPGGCASACLDAIDTFKQFENVRLIGAPSAGDTFYLDARPQELPSGKSLAVVPLKIWMDRPRKSGQIYRPDVEIDDLDWSTKRFLDAIEEDVAGRGFTLNGANGCKSRAFSEAIIVRRMPSKRAAD